MKTMVKLPEDTIGKATIPFGRVQKLGVQRQTGMGRIKTANRFIHP